MEPHGGGSSGDGAGGSPFHVPTSRPRRGAKSLEESALDDLHAFYVEFSQRLDDLSALELHRLEVLLGALAATEPPNLHRAWKENLVATLRHVESCYEDFFRTGGKCTLWPRGLRNGVLPSRTVGGTFSNQIYILELPGRWTFHRGVLTGFAFPFSQKPKRESQRTQVHEAAPGQLVPNLVSRLEQHIQHIKDRNGHHCRPRPILTLCGSTSLVRRPLYYINGHSPIIRMFLLLAQC